MHNTLHQKKKCFPTCCRCHDINGLPIRGLPFLRNDTISTKKKFVVWRLIISHIIRHCKFVLQGACTFLQKTQRHVLFKLEQRTRRRKNSSLTEFFHKLDNNGWKMHRGPCKKTKVYMYLYISLYENLFENRQIPTDYSESVQRPISANLGLNFYPGLFFVSSKVFSLAIFSILVRVGNHQIVGKRESNWICFLSFHIWFQISH